MAGNGGGDGFEATLVQAAAEAVGPALLLSSRRRGGPQYLFNAPEGFARLALEHRARPTGRLAALLLTSLRPHAAVRRPSALSAFATSSQRGRAASKLCSWGSAGKPAQSAHHHSDAHWQQHSCAPRMRKGRPEIIAGTGGLLLRLSQDGHGRLAVCGPPGTARYVHALRHFVRWLHPKVFITHVVGEEAVFEDEHVLAVPLLLGAASQRLESEEPGTSTAATSTAAEAVCFHVLGRGQEDNESASLPLSRQQVSVAESHASLCTQVEGVAAQSLQAESNLRKRETTVDSPRLTKKAKVENCDSEDTTDGPCNPLEAAGSRFSAAETCTHYVLVPKLHTFCHEGSTKTLVQQQLGKLQESSTCMRHPFTRDWGVASCARLHAEPAHARLPEFFTRSSPELAHAVELPLLEDNANPVYVTSPDARKLFSVSMTGHRRTTPQSQARKLLGYICHLKALSSKVLIVDCQEPCDVEQLCMEHPATELAHKVALAVHMSPKTVLGMPGYQRWMRSLSSRGMRQVEALGGAAQVGHFGSLAMVVKLNTVAPSFFPMPPLHTGSPSLGTSDTHDAVRSIDPDPTSTFTGVEDATDIVCQGRLLMRFILKSQGNQQLVEVDGSGQPELINVEALQAEARRSMDQPPDSCLASGEATGSKAGLAGNAMQQNTLKECTLDARAQQEGFEVTFLGTGCAEPSKYRGSSSISCQLHTPGLGILLDAGEGAWGQLVRKLGPDAALAFSNALPAIWLSHKHADHCLGLMQILHSRASDSPPLLIIGPRAVERWLNEVVEACASSSLQVPSFRYIHNCVLDGHRATSLSFSENTFDVLTAQPGSVQQWLLNSLHLQSIQSVPVEHCQEAFGLVIKSQDGWSLVYSGDTQPCQRLVRAGQGCTLLIHEATFEKGMEKHARKKKHSTVEEALLVAEQMKAQGVILTHFSQRYPKAVALDPCRSQHTCTAFDGMVVASSSLASLPQLQVMLVRALAHPPQDGQRSLAAGSQKDTDTCGPLRTCSRQEPGELQCTGGHHIITDSPEWPVPAKPAIIPANNPTILRAEHGLHGQRMALTASHTRFSDSDSAESP
eukprot:SM000010S04306  [mRNA]  locus=s10:832787:837561:- [translate_table: standard]